MPLTVEQFTERITSSGIISNEQLCEFLGGLPADASARADAEALARELVKQKKLTKFQAEQIYAGKGTSLSLGNYVILDKLGEGGMGMVLKAWHRRMERTVALKVIAPKVVKDPSALKRFQREVIAAAKLSHPNIVAAHDADEAKGTHFLVMEYVEGSDLSSLVKQHGPLPVEQAVNCIIQAARGLSFAHDKGVVHRDIKPHNLLLDKSGTVKILDMGLARIDVGFGGSAEHADLTRSGAMMGTVDYMAPEQAMDSKHADARSDVYSLGCTLFYLITGHVAFEADTVMKRLTAHQSAPPPSLVDQLKSESRRSGASQSALPLDSGLAVLDATFRRMVAKKPEDRPQSMLQVIAELERCLSSGSATVSVDSGSNPSAQADGANELQQFLQEISGESNASSSRTSPVRTVPVPSVRDAETIVDSASDSKAGSKDDATVVLGSSGMASSPNLTAKPSQSRKTILISVATVTVVAVLAIVAAMSGKSDKPTDENLATTQPVGKQAPSKAVSETPAVTHPNDLVPNSATSRMDAALQFDGDDIVTIPTLLCDVLAPYTWEAYVAAPQKAPAGRDGVVIGFGAKGESLAEVPKVDSPAQFLSLTKELKWRWKYGYGKDREGNVHSIATDRAERTHLACVCEEKTYRLYVDGKLQRSAEWNAPRKADGNFEFGPRFAGIIDEVRISKVARYKENFAPVPRYEPDANTLGLYHFDEAIGNELRDSSGHNHHGKIVGAKWVKADGSAIDSALAKTAAYTIPYEALPFSGHRYLLVESSGNWMDAKAKAEAMGGHLVTINSREERDWLRKSVLASVSGKGGQQVRTFIGASRKTDTSQWTWITGDPFDESLGPGKVSNPQNAVALTWSDNAWDGVGDSFVGSHFIVEWDPRWPLAPTKPEDIQHWLDANVEVTVRTAAPGGGSLDNRLTAATLPAGPATIVGLKYKSRGSALVDDLQLGLIAELTDLEELELGPAGAAFTPQGMRKLASLVYLRRVILHHFGISAAGLSDLLNSWPNLELLQVPHGTKRAEEWIAVAVTRPSIREISAYRADLTDASLALLEKMPQLRVLDLCENSFLTEAAIQRLAAAVPGCRIQYVSGSDKTKRTIIEPRTPPASNTQPPVVNTPPIR